MKLIIIDVANENAAEMEIKMQKVIGVTFKSASRLYYFDPVDNEEIKIHDTVIVETVRGVEIGKVVMLPKMIEPAPEILPIKPIVRIATQEDKDKIKSNREREREAFKTCIQKIREHELDMKLIDVQYTFDNTKVLFYFTSDGRIDFRNLVKDLAAIFKIRIELRQIGVRDAAKMQGGLGPCGREICCASYMVDFNPVSIKMAKVQNLSLNPSKISGTCGRLMCCLNNENETYIELNKRLPNVGDRVSCKDGMTGVVHSVNVLRQTVRVIVELEKEEKEIRNYPVSELNFKSVKKKHNNTELSKEELAELKGLED